MSFNLILTTWFSANSRNLPWRHTREPYKIWLSEIILQQTRVAQGLDYYTRFLDRFPTISDLAAAQEDDVLKLWEGLGYYSRARNLHQGAQQIVEQWDGVFPNEYDQILKIKGIGKYTAAAIASFAFGLCHPVLDGNVARFISRYAGIYEAVDSAKGQKQLYGILNQLIDPADPATFNQAIMEFGALHCKAKQALCDSCPFSASCSAFREGNPYLLPVKKEKTKVKDRYLYYGVWVEKGNIWLHKREGQDIWRNLYDFPLRDSTKPIDIKNLPPYPPQKVIIHLLSHRRLHIHFYRLKKASDWDLSEASAVSLSKLSRYAFPRPIQEYLASPLFISSF